VKPILSFSPYSVMVLASLAFLISPVPAEARDIPVIENSAQPTEGMRRIATTEIWRHGGDEDERLFGVVTKAIADPDGTIYLLDGQLSQVIAISSDGTLTGSVAREGDGPGEMRNPADLFLHPDGSLSVVQPFLGKLIQVDTDGTPAGEIHVGGESAQGGFNILQRGSARAGRLVLGGIAISYSIDGSYTQRNFFTLCRPDGGEIATCFQIERTTHPSALELDEGQSDFPFDRFAIGPDGRVYLAPERNVYRIAVYSANGSLECYIERPYENLNRSKAEKQLAYNIQAAYGRYYPSPPSAIRVENRHPHITGLHVQANGELWVRTGRGDLMPTDGGCICYDVFDPAGHYRSQVTIDCPGSAARDALFLVSRDRLIVVTGGVAAALSLQGVEGAGENETELEQNEVICYELHH
jgi:hypothetical protein